jgi:hypothetical protein
MIITRCLALWTVCVKLYSVLFSCDSNISFIIWVLAAYTGWFRMKTQYFGGVYMGANLSFLIWISTVLYWVSQDESPVFWEQHIYIYIYIYIYETHPNCAGSDEPHPDLHIRRSSIQSDIPDVVLIQLILYMAAWNMYRIEINIHEKELCVRLVIYKDYIYRDSRSTEHKMVRWDHSPTTFLARSPCNVTTSEPDFLSESFCSETSAAVYRTRLCRSPVASHGQWASCQLNT